MLTRILSIVLLTDSVRCRKLKLNCDPGSAVNTYVEVTSNKKISIASITATKIGGGPFLFGGLPRDWCFFIIVTSFSEKAIFFVLLVYNKRWGAAISLLRGEQYASHLNLQHYTAYVCYIYNKLLWYVSTYKLCNINEYVMVN